MLDSVDLSLVNWSRAQFALTAMYHWIFVPLTLGLGFIIAFMETIYVKTGNPEWKRITKFWMKLFGINFAIGVATGIILEFEFGTNWSNYSWFVGDIFGAPLAIEGIMAFFMESTFIAVMFFGWNKVSKRFHLTSTWLTAIGANLSAVWILVANAWMQDPRGMKFNPDTARNEMVNFWDIFLSPSAVTKFLHTTTSGFVLASIFVVGVSAWFILKKREILFAKRSMVVSATFGLLASIMLIASGDSSAREMAEKQPMKFAAMEALYEGKTNAPLVAIGLIGDPQDDPMDSTAHEDFRIKIEIPNMLSYMAFLKADAFVPGIKDLILGNRKHGIMSYKEKIKRGYKAQQTLVAYKKAIKEKSPDATILRAKFEDEEWVNYYFKYFGYGSYYDPDPVQLEKNAFKMIPPISLTFYAFHIMVILGGHFLMLFACILFLLYKNNLENNKIVLWTSVWTIPLVYIASEAGWVVAEVGRQPWVIQDLMTTSKAVSQIDSSSVMITFFLFAFTFTALLIAEIKILTKQIKIGPKKQGGRQ
ncbi:cytochrome ubiquinol oxidase subunit I [Labilibacter marinus]|uniref:cytochrome ubiquinol oxidase subunit I n=1 Tax=Labilibacter marinus TaxID=1477105 RepID=UPI000829B511|nr:cytochrome ubiquinol oxidase subunit I [Labilibacter marinus]